MAKECPVKPFVAVLRYPRIQVFSINGKLAKEWALRHGGSVPRAVMQGYDAQTRTIGLFPCSVTKKGAYLVRREIKTYTTKTKRPRVYYTIACAKLMNKFGLWGNQQRIQLPVSFGEKGELFFGPIGDSEQ